MLPPLTERFGTHNQLTRLSPESARASILFFRYAGILTDDCFLLTAIGLSGRALSELLLLLLIAPLSGLLFSCFASHSSLFCLKYRTKKMTLINLSHVASPVLLHTLHTPREGLAKYTDNTYMLAQCQWHLHPEPKGLKIHIQKRKTNLHMYVHSIACYSKWHAHSKQ